MANELLVLQHKDGETETRERALDLHFRLKADIEIAGNAIADFTEKLKEMRDSRLYLELGYEKFGDYTQREHHFNERQAYNYINAFETYGKEFLQSNAKNWGITKLQLLATASPLDREQIIESVDVENTSVSELKEKIAEIESLKTQLSFLQEQKTVIETRPFDEIETKIREELEPKLREEIGDDLIAEYSDKLMEMDNQLKIANEKAMSDEELKKFKDNAALEAKEAAADDVKKLRAELKAALDASDKKDAIAKNDSKAIADAEQRAQAAEEKAKTAAEDFKKAAEELKRVDELEAKVKEAERQKVAMEKQIQISANPEFTRFKFLFEAAGEAINAVIEQMEKIEGHDKERARQALVAFLGGIEI